MALRNFWIEVEIDGRKTLMKGGPQAKNGGMRVRVLQRDNGSKIVATDIHCYAVDDKLHTSVEAGLGNKIVVTTVR